MTALAPPPVPFVVRYARNGPQAGVALAQNRADFNILVGSQEGISRSAPGFYTVLYAGLWQVIACMSVLGTGGSSHRPRVSVLRTRSGIGSFLFYQEAGISLGVNTYAFTVAFTDRLQVGDTLEFFWETDGAASDLDAPGGIGCTLEFVRLG